MGAALALERRADDDARTAIGGIGDQRLGRPLAGAQEGRLVDQILRRIAGDEQLGEQHEVGALARRIGARLARLGEIAWMSPTIGLSWATAMRRTSGADFLVMQGM